MAREDDVAALVALEQDSFGSAAWSHGLVRDELAKQPETRFVLIAEDEGGLVGYGVLLMVADTADVQRVAVAPGRRRSGIGGELIAGLLGEASRRGCITALLEVDADNAAGQALYRAAGFSIIHRRDGYYGPGRHALVMSRPLPCS